MKKLVCNKDWWIFLFFLVLLFLIPMLLVSKYLPLAFTIPNTVPIIWRILISTIILIFTEIFVKAIFYSFLPIFTVILAVIFLSNEKITIWRFKLSEKRNIWQLFLGYFFLFFPFYYIVRTSVFERIPEEADFFIYSHLTGMLILILLITTRYLIKKNTKMGTSLQLGNFFLLIFASTIILQSFMLYSPQLSSLYVFLKWGISTENERFNAMSNYYYPLIFSFYSSVLDYLILERKKKE